VGLILLPKVMDEWLALPHRLFGESWDKNSSRRFFIPTYASWLSSVLPYRVHGISTPFPTVCDVCCHNLADRLRKARHQFASIMSYGIPRHFCNYTEIVVSVVMIDVAKLGVDFQAPCRVASRPPLLLHVVFLCVFH
jgi:hypothetical protein